MIRPLPKTDAERAREAEQRAAYWLHRGNLADERGDMEQAERHYARAQKHHDAMNRYLAPTTWEHVNELLDAGKEDAAIDIARALIRAHADPSHPLYRKTLLRLAPILEKKGIIPNVWT